MATINVSFDTVTKACKITKDDVEITDVSYLSVSRKWDCESGKASEKFTFNVSSGWKDDASGTSEYHQLCAAEDGSLVPADPLKFELSESDRKAINETVTKALLNK